MYYLYLSQSICETTYQYFKYFYGLLRTFKLSYVLLRVLDQKIIELLNMYLHGQDLKIPQL